MTSVFLSLLIPSCNCHSNKRWYTGGMLRRYPKSNVSCCAVYQQSLSKMMHFYTNLWILKHTMKQTSGIATVIYARLRIVIGTDIWARVSTSNHCTVGGPWMCQKCSVFFLSSSSWTSYLQEIPATIRPQKFIWILQLLRDPRILHRVETRQFERLKHLPWV